MIELPEGSVNASVNKTVAGTLNIAGHIPEGSTYTIFTALVQDLSDADSQVVVNDYKFTKQLVGVSATATNNWKWDGALAKIDYKVQADLFFMAKNTKLTLPNVEAASGARYSYGDVEFWTHQGAATLVMEGSEQSLNCVEQTAENANELIDANGNIITAGCKAWFDGCNICQVGEPGKPMACTRKFCAPEVMEEERCLDDEQK